MGCQLVIGCIIGTPSRLCSVEGCGRRLVARGLCHSHYERQRRGSTRTGPILDTPEARFWIKVNENGPVAPGMVTPCWLWLGATASEGRYGSFFADGKVRRAHRVAYEWLHGPLPDYFDIDHLCRVTLCVRPDHLEAVTHRENVLRGQSLQAQNARKTHCLRGHEFTSANTERRKDGGRTCRKCRAIRRRLVRALEETAQVSA